MIRNLWIKINSDLWTLNMGVEFDKGNNSDNDEISKSSSRSHTHLGRIGSVDIRGDLGV